MGFCDRKLRNPKDLKFYNFPFILGIYMYFDFIEPFMKKNRIYSKFHYLLCHLFQNLNWQRDLSDSSYLSSGTWFGQDNPATVIGSDGSVFVTTQKEKDKENQSSNRIQ